MVWLRTWLIGIKSLAVHPMRSLLTVLGIFIGVASVIWLVAIGEGISQEAQRQIEGLGADNIIVRSIKPLNPTEQDSSSFILPYGLLRQDYDRLVETIPTIHSALPIREMRRQVRYADRIADARVVGCTPEYAEVTRLEVNRGRFIEPIDLDNQQNLCVLAAKLAEQLFPYENPLGRRVFLMDHEDYYTVVGVLKPRTATAAIGGSLEAQDFSYDIYMPITTVRNRIGDTVVQRRGGSREGEHIELNQITLRVQDVKFVERTAKLVEETLEPYHGKTQDVAVVVPLELLRQAETTRIMFMVFMGLIAAISLLVGGIGIMNIMLATVTERTREIGIRRALGACRRDILWQFLVETVVLSVVGGVTGILVGYACPLAIDLLRWFMENFLPPHIIASLPDVVRNVQPVILAWSVVGAFLISVFIGVAFGIYPAFRAAQMDPIEALRHE
ncbi:MAG: ABC transporter permease [Pirellulaceae bacterium]|nr:ABC transporter permease [Pirellulaceae bacterium]